MLLPLHTPIDNIGKNGATDSVLNSLKNAKTNCSRNTEGCLLIPLGGVGNGSFDVSQRLLAFPEADVVITRPRTPFFLILLFFY